MFTGTFTLRSRKSRHDHSSGNVRVCENEDMFESVGTWWRNLTHRHGDDRNNDDTLDDATNTLLSILPLASIVVDEHDEVIRAHPDAYALGVVRDDAIAYSPDGKGITVSVKPNEDGTKVLLSVLDRGCGIAQKEQSRIFERFYRGGNQNGHSEEGIGLGLAIVKHVALTHHGSASVWSAPGQGSTFTLELPVARN